MRARENLSNGVGRHPNDQSKLVRGSREHQLPERTGKRGWGEVESSWCDIEVREKRRARGKNDNGMQKNDVAAQEEVVVG